MERVHSFSFRVENLELPARVLLGSPCSIIFTERLTISLAHFSYVYARIACALLAEYVVFIAIVRASCNIRVCINRYRGTEHGDRVRSSSSNSNSSSRLASAHIGITLSLT